VRRCGNDADPAAGDQAIFASVEVGPASGGVRALLTDGSVAAYNINRGVATARRPSAGPFFAKKPDAENPAIPVIVTIL